MCIRDRCAMGEAFAFAKKAGLDPPPLFDAIKGGFAQSAVMDGKVPKLLSRDFSARQKARIYNMWLADQWKDYEVLDTSNGEKLER